MHLDTAAQASLVSVEKKFRVSRVLSSQLTIIACLAIHFRRLLCRKYSACLSDSPVNLQEETVTPLFSLKNAFQWKITDSLQEVKIEEMAREVKVSHRNVHLSFCIKILTLFVQFRAAKVCSLNILST